ncbi:MAG: hypothetical protein KGL48_05320 [Sphingomonadales bacterium]|nr:hypothetical protein [Sphingomonadales bacterium]
MIKSILTALAAFTCAVATSPALADNAPFDLAGPTLKITVTRKGATLPISEVPQLAPGDKVSIEALLPPDETAHYLLVATSLRSPTNPPPDQWFARSETWKRMGHGGGPISLTVPADAQHLVVFLAPATGGDFSTLRNAVKGRPGAFVRAAQDLEQASLDRGRYEAFLAAIHKAASEGPDTLARLAPVVASSLRIKINDDCLQQLNDLQAACLFDSTQSVVLSADDSSDSSSSLNPLVGAATDLAMSFSATPAGGLGTFSPYISAIQEIIGIFGAMHTAKYQYIPALGLPDGTRFRMVLNAPPSFKNPRSVLMAALPAVRTASPPVLQSRAGSAPPCFGASALVLPVTTNPLLYSTAFAHALTLRVALPDKTILDLPLTPDAARRGLDIGSQEAMVGNPTGPLKGTIHGQWGFQSFAGPQVTLDTPGAWQWKAGDSRKDDGEVILTGAPTSCVSAVRVKPLHGTDQKAVWKLLAPDRIAVTLPTQGDKPGPVAVTVEGPDGTKPVKLTVAPPLKSPPPLASVIAHAVEAPNPASPEATTVVLDSPDEIPADARLTFTLKAAEGDHFTGKESLEVGTVNGDGLAKLTFGHGLTLVDSRVLVAALAPAEVLGASAYGPLRTRVVRAGVRGDWLPVGTVVRLPRIGEITCPVVKRTPCSLSGDGLYLLASLSANRDFDDAISVPEGFAGFSLTVPHPAAGGMLFVRLHDAPEVVNHIKLAGSLVGH